MRKLIAWPVRMIGRVLASVGMFILLISQVIKGKTLDETLDRLDLGITGLNAAENKDDAIIELVEKHYGFGKATQVADILNKK